MMGSFPNQFFLILLTRGPFEAISVKSYIRQLELAMWGGQITTQRTRTLEELTPGLLHPPSMYLGGSPSSLQTDPQSMWLHADMTPVSCGKGDHIFKGHVQTWKWMKVEETKLLKFTSDEPSLYLFLNYSLQIHHSSTEPETLMMKIRLVTFKGISHFKYWSVMNIYSPRSLPIPWSIWVSGHGRGSNVQSDS